MMQTSESKTLGTIYVLLISGALCAGQVFVILEDGIDDARHAADIQHQTMTTE